MSTTSSPSPSFDVTLSGFNGSVVNLESLNGNISSSNDSLDGIFNPSGTVFSLSVPRNTTFFLCVWLDIDDAVIEDTEELIFFLKSRNENDVFESTNFTSTNFTVAVLDNDGTYTYTIWQYE